MNLNIDHLNPNDRLIVLFYSNKVYKWAPDVRRMFHTLVGGRYESIDFYMNVTNYWFMRCLARLRDETATCPNCRCVISRDLCSRNLAVEKAVCELPGLCRFCSKELPRALLDKHQVDYCEERIVRCTFARIGCPWSGPFHESGMHFLCSTVYLSMVVPLFQ